MDEIVQYIVVRTDLDMSPGKVIAQCCHATRGFMIDHELTETEQAWFDNSHPTIVIKVKSEEKLLAIVKQAKENNIMCHLVTDEGRTELNGSTNTCLALGPDKKSLLQPITKRLQLLKQF